MTRRGWLASDVVVGCIGFLAAAVSALVGWWMDAWQWFALVMLYFLVRPADINGRHRCRPPHGVQEGTWQCRGCQRRWHADNGSWHQIPGEPPTIVSVPTLEHATMPMRPPREPGAASLKPDGSR